MKVNGIEIVNPSDVLVADGRVYSVRDLLGEGEITVQKVAAPFIANGRVYNIAEIEGGDTPGPEPEPSQDTYTYIIRDEMDMNATPERPLELDSMGYMANVQDNYNFDLRSYEAGIPLYACEIRKNGEYLTLFYLRDTFWQDMGDGSEHAYLSGREDGQIFYIGLTRTKQGAPVGRATSPVSVEIKDSGSGEVIFTQNVTFIYDDNDGVVKGTLEVPDSTAYQLMENVLNQQSNGNYSITQNGSGKPKVYVRVVNNDDWVMPYGQYTNDYYLKLTGNSTATTTNSIEERYGGNLNWEDDGTSIDVEAHIIISANSYNQVRPQI